MTVERHDEESDPRTAELLRRWGAQVRAGTAGGGADLFEPPTDLGALEERAEAGDAAPLRRVGPARWWLGAAVAAAVLLSAAGWWIARQGTSPAALPGRAGGVLLSSLSVSTSPTLLRGEAAASQFRSGDAIYVHLAADRSGVVAVALLDANMALVAVGEGLPLNAGPNHLGPFVLDENAGTESIIVIGRTEPWPEGAFPRLIAEIDVAVESQGLTHAQRLALIRDELARRSGSTAQAYTYAHVPR